MLAVDDLDDTTVERAGALVAREQAAARQVRPELPAAFEDAGACAAALQRLRDSGHRGLVVADRGPTSSTPHCPAFPKRCRISDSDATASTGSSRP